MIQMCYTCETVCKLACLSFFFYLHCTFPEWFSLGCRGRKCFHRWQKRRSQSQSQSRLSTVLTSNRFSKGVLSLLLSVCSCWRWGGVTRVRVPFRTQPFHVACQVAGVQHFGDVGQMVCVGCVFEVRVSQPLCQLLREVTALESNRKPFSNPRWKQLKFGASNVQPELTEKITSFIEVKGMDT